ncbi:hypothetical protein A3Q41_04835 [Rhodococcoides fascians]|uniref:Uncharacterized protein n=2 Tax=Rhodococcoides fascians TaxID=1828 RepID=A0A143QU36_RHOFA|nr:hypothetical protein [Rhodococcus fascians]AMY26097.1 hypothetical protein A3Q41_04835 [Rhodococcus fascians]
MTNTGKYPTDGSAESYGYCAAFEHGEAVTVVRSLDPDYPADGERFDKPSRTWVTDIERRLDHINSDDWVFLTVEEADAVTERKAFGLQGIPIGDPGFTACIDIDAPMAEFNDAALQLLREMTEWSEELHARSTTTEQVQVVAEIDHAGWFHAGSLAMRIARVLELRWPVLGVQICRTDVWDNADQTVHWVAPNFADVLSARTNEDCVVTLEVQHNAFAELDFDSSLVPNETSFPTASSLGFPQLNFDCSGQTCVGAADALTKAAHIVSEQHSIVRIRASRADFYRISFLCAGALPATEPAPMSITPSWHFSLTTYDERCVVISDLQFDFSGWSVKIAQDDELHIGQVVPDRVWRDGEDDLNLFGQREFLHGWLAMVEPGARLAAFITPTGTRLEVDSWTHMTEWLTESLADKPVALIIDLGPSDYIPSEHDSDDVVNAQLQVMADDVFMVRRSRTELGHLRLADYSTSFVELDTWYLAEHFDDCTDGYLFTRDRRLAAETCVTWFRDNQGAHSTGELGCSYWFADELLPNDD